MIERPDVDALMAGELGQWLQGQAAERDEARKATNKRRFIVVLVLAPAILFVWIAFRLDFGPIFALSVITFGFGLAWAEIPKKRAIRKVKEGINHAIAGALRLEYAHDCEPERPFELAKLCRLVPDHDRGRFEDRWSGHFGDIPFALHEAKLEKRRGSGKNRRWVTVFRGIIMSVGYKRRFHGTTILVRDNAHRKFWGGKKDHVTVDGLQLDYAEMVHPDFEDAFDIYTSDQVEARHLIDPLYVEQLIALEHAYSGSNVGTIFHEGSLVVALKAENMFESGNIEARRDRAMIERTLDQFGRLAALAKTLNEREPVPGERF